MLAELGIEPVEVGIMDAPTDDTAAMESSVRLIAERFKASHGIDSKVELVEKGKLPRFAYKAARVVDEA